MEITPLSIEGAWLITPRQHGDARGLFLEWFKESVFQRAVGHPFHLAQANCSVSTRGTIRGIHYADIPPSQAKYVTCVTGAIIDVVVDIRVGSPTFGQYEKVLLDPKDRRAVYLSEGLGHGFAALEDNTTVMYLCSAEYNPDAEHELFPFDSTLNIDWPYSLGECSLSAKDDAAPGVTEAMDRLPKYDDWLEFRERLMAIGQ